MKEQREIIANMFVLSIPSPRANLQRLKNKYIVRVTFNVDVSLNEFTVCSPYMIITSMILLASTEIVK